MIGAFNTAFKAFQGLLSADFWSSVFIPVALFAAIHALILTRFDWNPSLDELFNDTGKYAKLAVLVLAGLVVAGYVLQSFLPLLRGVLDGSLLPASLHDALRRDRLPEARAIRAQLQRDLQAIQRFEAAYAPVKAAYAAARTLPAAPDAASVNAAAASVEALDASMASGELPPLKSFEQAQRLLCVALAVNSPLLPAGAGDAQNSLRLDEAANRMSDLLRDAVRQARYDHDARGTRHRVSGALDHTRATLFGDARHVVERYAYDMYAVRFDFLWPRLLMMLRAEAKPDPSLAAVDAARARVDFAILSLLLACSVPLAWIPAVLWRGEPAWLILVIGGATPLALQLFYRMAVESQLAFGEVVKTTVDRHRFLVLRMLRQALPATHSEERELWGRIHRAEEDGRDTDLAYAEPAP